MISSFTTTLFRRPSGVLPTGPLGCMGAVLVLAAVPILDQAAAWTPLMFLVCVTARLALQWRRASLPPLALRLVLLALALGSILLSYGSFFGIEAGFGVLLILISLKTLEANSTRDLQVLALLGYFLGLCGLFFSQDLSRWLYVGLTSVLVTAALIRVQEDEACGALGRSLRLAGVMLLQAMPLMVLFFLFLPRPHLEFRFLLGASALGSAGMTDLMRPGSIAALAERPEVAFRASFPEGLLPLPSGLYWRGPVLWAGNGLNWERGPRLLETRDSHARGARFVQRITLEPHGTNWLFALDRPISVPTIAWVDAGGSLRSQRQVMARTFYTVTSQPENGEAKLPPDQLEAALRKPGHVSPAVLALARTFREGAAGPRQIAERALEYFRQGHFTYSLQPGEYRSSELDEFLFERRSGFCEHYAAAYATLMRLAGVPSRVIAGYLGGEFNLIGKYYIVRQSDAHAWCEIWVAGSGWLRVDPTTVTAPDRISYGLQNYLDGQGAQQAGLGRQAPGNSYWRDLLRQSTMFWESVSYQWDSRVLTFDDDSQRSLLTWSNVGHWGTGPILSCLAGATALVLITLAGWMRLSREPLDRAQREFARFCRRSAAAGVPREPSEGPLAFTERLAGHFPAQAGPIQEVGRVYAAARYGRTPPPAARLGAAVRAVGRLRRPVGWTSADGRPLR